MLFDVFDIKVINSLPFEMIPIIFVYFSSKTKHFFSYLFMS